MFFPLGSCSYWKKLQADYRSTSSSATSFWVPSGRSKHFQIRFPHFAYFLPFAFQLWVSAAQKISTVTRVEKVATSLAASMFLPKIVVQIDVPKTSLLRRVCQDEFAKTISDWCYQDRKKSFLSMSIPFPNVWFLRTGSLFFSRSRLLTIVKSAVRAS